MTFPRTRPLPPLPLSEWEDTKITLHLFCQVVGKVRLALMPKKNHWWHVPLYVSARGVTTRPIPLANGDALEVEIDVRGHLLRVTRTPGEEVRFPLRGLTVADFHEELMDALTRLDVDVTILAKPFDMPFDTPFPADHEHGSWDPDPVERWWHVLLWSSGVLEEFSGWFYGKQTPVHLFWHSFDLALTRFSGRRAPEMPEADPVTQEAYSHEVISFGFWAGDESIPDPAFYAYTAPEPDDLTEQPLAGPGARWHDTGRGHMALLMYDELRESGDPRAELLSFLDSAYLAGARTAGWEEEELRTEWAPEPEVPGSPS